jgi:Uma2 family endonuclease
MMAAQARRDHQHQHLRVLPVDQPPTLATWDDFERFVLDHPEQRWELFDGRAWEKSGMGSEHNERRTYLAALLIQQLDRREYRVRSENAFVQRSAATFFIPDVVVVPADLVRTQLGKA